MVRAVFMGSDIFSRPILEALLAYGSSLPNPVETVGVVTRPDRQSGRGRQVTPGPIKLLAAERGLPVAQPARLRTTEEVSAVLDLRPELIVVASYGSILPSVILDAPVHGSLNLHPSLLPRHRGPSPVAGAILAGDTVTGTTLMLMEARMDAGPILAQETVPVQPGETAGRLTSRLAELSGGLLLRTLPGWLDGRVIPASQDDSVATYTRLMTKNDGLIDWLERAIELSRQVRAFNPWPVAYTPWEGNRVRIWQALPLPGQAPPGLVAGMGDGLLRVGTGEGLLGIAELQLPGGRPMPPDDLLRGYPGLLEARLGG